MNQLFMLVTAAACPVHLIIIHDNLTLIKLLSAPLSQKRGFGGISLSELLLLLLLLPLLLLLQLIIIIIIIIMIIIK